MNPLFKVLHAKRAHDRLKINRRARAAFVNSGCTRPACYISSRRSGKIVCHFERTEAMIADLTAKTAGDGPAVGFSHRRRASVGSVELYSLKEEHCERRNKKAKK